jgi:Ca2+-binding EF-hand superfamily protein
MICEADPNGHGYISYHAFENIIATFKKYKE